MKPIIFIDCNSLNHLSRIEFNRSKTHVWLWKYFKVYTCNIVKKEFGNGITKAESYKKLLNRHLSGKEKVFNPKYYQSVESNWLNFYYYKKNLSANDAGERQLLCTILEKICLYKFPNSIFLTDDLNAIEYFLRKSLNDIPYGNIWTSLDLILFLYLSRREISFEQASDALRDIISLTSFPTKHYKKPGDSDDMARLSISSDYLRKLKTIQKLRDIIPS